MNETTIKAEKLSFRIRELLAGQGPEVQGIVLADLASIFFASHHPALREGAIMDWLKCMHDLIPLSEKELFEQLGGKPQGWAKQ